MLIWRVQIPFKLKDVSYDGDDAKDFSLNGNGPDYAASDPLMRHRTRLCGIGPNYAASDPIMRHRTRSCGIGPDYAASDPIMRVRYRISGSVAVKGEKKFAATIWESSHIDLRPTSNTYFNVLAQRENKQISC